MQLLMYSFPNLNFQSLYAINPAKLVKKKKKKIYKLDIQDMHLLSFRERKVFCRHSSSVLTPLESWKITPVPGWLNIAADSCPTSGGFRASLGAELASHSPGAAQSCPLSSRQDSEQWGH